MVHIFGFVVNITLKWMIPCTMYISGLEIIFTSPFGSTPKKFEVIRVYGTTGHAVSGDLVIVSVSVYNIQFC